MRANSNEEEDEKEEVEEMKKNFCLKKTRNYCCKMHVCIQKEGEEDK